MEAPEEGQEGGPIEGLLFREVVVEEAPEFAGCTTDGDVLVVLVREPLVVPLQCMAYRCPLGPLSALAAEDGLVDGEDLAALFSGLSDVLLELYDSGHLFLWRLQNLGPESDLWYLHGDAPALVQAPQLVGADLRLVAQGELLGSGLHGHADLVVQGLPADDVVQLLLRQEHGLHGPASRRL